MQVTEKTKHRPSALRKPQTTTMTTSETIPTTTPKQQPPAKRPRTKATTTPAGPTSMTGSSAEATMYTMSNTIWGEGGDVGQLFSRCARGEGSRWAPEPYGSKAEEDNSNEIIGPEVSQGNDGQADGAYTPQCEQAGFFHRAGGFQPAFEPRGSNMIGPGPGHSPQATSTIFITNPVCSIPVSSNGKSGQHSHSQHAGPEPIPAMGRVEVTERTVDEDAGRGRDGCGGCGPTSTIYLQIPLHAGTHLIPTLGRGAVIERTRDEDAGRGRGVSRGEMPKGSTCPSGSADNSGSPVDGTGLPGPEGGRVSWGGVKSHGKGGEVGTGTGDEGQAPDICGKHQQIVFCCCFYNSVFERHSTTYCT